MNKNKPFKKGDEVVLTIFTIKCGFREVSPKLITKLTEETEFTVGYNVYNPNRFDYDRFVFDKETGREINKHKDINDWCYRIDHLDDRNNKC